MNFTFEDMPGVIRNHQWLLLVLAGLFWTTLFGIWPMRKANSVGRKLAIFVLTFLIVVLPPPIFALSGFLQPDSKATAPYGWLDCWQAGKLALTPLMLWAVAALYRHELFPKRSPTPRWILFGLAWGALVSGASLFHGAFYCLRKIDLHDLTRVGSDDFVGLMFFSIPAYVFIWYSIRALQAWRASDVRPREITLHSLAGSVFWIGSVPLARMFYNKLPENPPSCFIVTAASRGHRRIVGESLPIVRGGCVRFGNPQLIRFWAFEDSWQNVSPASHRLFRRIYNVIGPRIAARIRSPWAADAVHLLLKPAECLALLCFALHHKFQSLENRGTANSSDWKSAEHE
jgi:hypothetical protein